MSKEIHHAPRDKSISLPLADASAIHHAVRGELAIGHTMHDQSWQPG
jgi:hypothetical protein